MTGDPPHPGAPEPPDPPKHGATYWDELEASFADLEAGGRVIRAEVTGSWRILQPKTPGQRCACSAPDIGSTSTAADGTTAVCPHGRAWRYGGPAGPGYQPRRWVELHGLARWWAARKANRR